MKYSLNIIFVSLIFIFTVAIFLHTDSAISQDLGRHLALGRIIWTERYIPSTNLFSYTYPDFPFINHHWGSEVIFYLVERLFSINGLIILKLSLIIFAFSLLFLFTVKRVNFISLVISSLLALEILRERTEVRPEIFALFFYSLFLIVLYKDKEKEGRLIWILPLLELFWVNLHISFIFGLAIYFLFLLERIILKKAKIKYFILGLLLLATTIINPFGWRGALSPLTIFDNYGYSIVENQPPFFLEQLMDNPTILYFKIAIFLLLFTAPFLLLGKYFFETATVAATSILSYMAIRHFPFFGLSLIFPFSLGLTLARGKISSYLKLSRPTIFWVRITLGAIIIGFLTREIYGLLSNQYYLTRGSMVRTGFGQVKGAREAVDFFLKNKLSGPIFNNFDIGSYLIYRLYPAEKVFVDGRPEAYPVSFFQQVYIPMQEKEDVWREVERKYYFQTIVFSHTDATPWGRSFVRRIANDPSWVIVYFDDYGLTLVRKDSVTENFQRLKSSEELRKYGVSRIQEANQPDILIRLANFFNLIGFADLDFLARVKAKGILSQ